MNARIVRRGDKYQVIVYWGSYLEDGKRKPIRETRTFDLEREAKTWRNKKLALGKRDSNESFATFLDQWMDTIELSPNTRMNYESIIKQHLSKVGHVPVGKLTTRDVKEAVGEGKPKAVRTRLAVMRSALNWGMADGLLSENIALKVPLPKVTPAVSGTPSPEELQRIVGMCGDKWFYRPVLIAATTGMRKGEVLALRWMDVDDEYIHVRRTLYWKDGPRFKEMPKNLRSRRVKMMEATKQELAIRGKPEELVCAREDGRPFDPTSLTKAFKRRTGYSFHQLRHAHATELALRGVNPRAVQERLGHSDVAITLRLYTEVLPTMQDNAVEVLDDAWKAHEKQK